MLVNPVHDYGMVGEVRSKTNEDLWNAYRAVQAHSVVHDAVYKPKHYDLGNGMEVIDVRKVLLDKIDSSMEVYLDMHQVDCWSRAWEYLTRFMDKNGEEDLKKAKFYLDRLVDSL